MATELSPVLMVVKEILNNIGLKGLHVREIAEIAVAKNKNMGLTVDDFCKKIQGALAANLKLKSSKPTFTTVKWDKGAKKGKPKQGWYRLKLERTQPASEVVLHPKANKAFTGKAGEYAVMSELLFWEFNASIMTVDDGIDIVASKENKFFHIQVKTATRQATEKYVFTLSHASFKKYNTTNVFYVFVLRQNLNNEFIIIPSGQINYFINSGVITNSPVLSLTININSKKTEYILNGKANITPFYGKFNEIIT